MGFRTPNLFPNFILYKYYISTPMRSEEKSSRWCPWACRRRLSEYPRASAACSASGIPAASTGNRLRHQRNWGDMELHQHACFRPYSCQSISNWFFVDDIELLCRHSNSYTQGNLLFSSLSRHCLFVNYVMAANLKYTVKFIYYRIYVTNEMLYSFRICF